MMSLDVYLTLDTERAHETRQGGTPRIFIREHGQTKAIMRAEWEVRFPGREPVMAPPRDEPDGSSCVYSGNITHNLTGMAQAADLYMPCWHPESLGIIQAVQLAPFLRAGLQKLLSDRTGYERLNPANGWGSYAVLVQFVADYLAACEATPQATVTVWR